MKKASTAAAAASVSVPFFNANAQEGKKLKIGVVGCGGSGTRAAIQAMRADNNCELWAMGDLYHEILDLGERVLTHELRIAPEKVNIGNRKFVGLDAYKHVIDSGVDVILLATPPAFRPMMFEAAVEAGVHSFIEIPCATDVAGMKRFMAAGRKAKEKNLSVSCGLVYRYSKHGRELFGRLQDGQIGDIMAIDATYHTNLIKPMPPESDRPNGMSDTEWQIRNWYNFAWLSGDGILEQGIHSIDKAFWAMGDNIEGIKCYAQGGRNRPNNVCNTWDHFHVTFVWPNGVRANIDWTQYAADQSVYRENYDHILGTNGKATLDFRSAQIEGNQTWRYRPPRDGEVSPYQNGQNEFFGNLRQGNRHSDEEWIARSTMLSLMARYAAYTGEEVTWEKIFSLNEKLVPDPAIWDAPLPVRPLQIPGVTPYPPGV